MKTKLIAEGSELSHKLGQLKMLAEDGKMRDTDVADTEQLLRLPAMSVMNWSQKPEKVSLPAKIFCRRAKRRS